MAVVADVRVAATQVRHIAHDRQRATRVKIIHSAGRANLTEQCT